MKNLLLLLFTLHYSLLIAGQEIPVSTEQQLENQSDADQSETEDDALLQELEQYKKHPLDINTADADELKQLQIISDLQIASLISYRSLLGKLVSIYELQAVPLWDISTIKKIAPFITTSPPLSLAAEMGKRSRDGEHSFLLRVSQVLERSEGYSNGPAENKYRGSPQRIFFRYRYNYKNVLQFGVTGDKDAGEQFFKGAQKKGFDFYSVHLFARKMGLIQALAIGDFTVSMGQGLIQWQGLAFKKSSLVTGIKRQSAVLRPYSSAGEFYFHRGAGITIRKGKWEATAFASLRKLNANFVIDTVNQEDYISSFLTSGYNRTSNEVADKNKLAQTSFGTAIQYRNRKWHIGVNAINYHFSLPVHKREEPYNLYAISGKNWYNLGVDYSYTRKNIHFFGEAAADKNFNTAFINGLLISVDARVDMAIGYRSISSAYQSVNGNAFTENTYPTNETGMYAGITIRPAPQWQIDAYADLYRFPWLKYQVDAPAVGRDFLIQLTYRPNKQLEVYSRFRNESESANQPDNSSVTNFLVTKPKQGWRTQTGYRISSGVTIRNRVELLWYDKRGENRETGFLTFADIIYKPLLSPFGGVVRLQYFETDGYNSRLYAYENDVLYSYSIPVFSEKGFRYHVTLSLDVGKKLSFWLRWAQTVYPGKKEIGSGLDNIAQNRKTEVKLQGRLVF
ncbi:MAG: helix-hairpin-helix domain-containing protein [Chitinophagaceae bacterium]